MSERGMRPHPDSLYYHIAANAVREAKTETDEFRRKQFVAIAMVFAALCLEAFVNQQYDWGKKRKSAVKKWRELPGLLNAKEGFVEDREPFATFTDLVHTRNERLVHFGPAGETHYHGVEADRRYFGDLVGNVSLAEGYVDCVRQMITELHRLTGGRTAVPRYLEGEEYLSTIWASVTTAYEVLKPKEQDQQ